MDTSGRGGQNSLHFEDFVSRLTENDEGEWLNFGDDLFHERAEFRFGFVGGVDDFGEADGLEGIW